MNLYIEKFLLLLWKNFLLQWRNRCQTFFGIASPIVVIILLFAVRKKSPLSHEDGKSYTPFDPSNDFNLKNLILYWSPTNNDIDMLMKGLAASLKSGGSVKQLSLKDSNSLEEHLLSVTDNATWGNGDVVVGIQFEDSLATASKLPPHIDITIRVPAELSMSSNKVSGESWNTDNMFQVYLRTPRNPQEKDGGSPPYFASGLLAIQKELSYSITNYFKKQVHKTDFNPSSLKVLMQRFPHGPYTLDNLQIFFQFATPLFILFGFIPLFNSTAFAIGNEKEAQLKETMKIMGLPGWLHWAAWFAKSFIFFLIPIIVIVYFMCGKWNSQADLALLAYSSPYVILLILICYACASIGFCFAISAFFSKASFASTATLTVYTMSYFLYDNKMMTVFGTSFAEKLLSCLLPAPAIAYAFELVLVLESTKTGAQWNSFWTPTSTEDPLNLGHVLLMLVLSVILYISVTLYVEEIFPGDYGVPKKWNFPFTKSYWYGTSSTSFVNTTRVDKRKNKFFEKEPTNLEVGVKIENLRKEFSKNVVAVKNVTLNLYKDQITILLGHNGAGKTTIMDMLAGMIPPTSGWATIAGHDIESDLSGARNSLGFCPQHDIIFDKLTVREHLYFYNRIKGLDKEETSEEIARFLERLEFTDKEHAMASTLSGGMKRKLSIAIALCGNSKVVLLDEPTSGMDPSARRSLWNLLKSQKQGRTILLSTHFMDEADLLGDRIAIMFEGEVQCCGSSYFLKKAYGADYRLTMERNPECDIKQVTSLLRRHIPNIKVESSIGSELTYAIDEGQSAVFQNMLYDLETSSSSLGISSYGISIANLDDVFLKVKLKADQEKNVNQKKTETTEATVSTDDYFLKYEAVTGSDMWYNQILAMSMKLNLSLLRGWKLFTSLTITTLLLVTMHMASLQLINVKQPVLKYTLDSYPEPITPLTWKSKSPYIQSYKDHLTVNNHKFVDWEEKDMVKTVLDEDKNDRYKVRLQYIAGARFEDDNTIISMFNNDPLHSTPLTLQMALNSVLKHEVTNDHNLQFSLHPLPFSSRSQLQRLHMSQGTANTTSINLGFALIFLCSYYVMFYTKERTCNVKHLQFVSGVKGIAFWATAYICDLLTFAFVSCCIVIVIIIYQEENYKTFEQLGQIFLLLFLLGLSSLPLTYIVSFCTKKPNSAIINMILIMLGGLFCFVGITLYKKSYNHPTVDFIHGIMLLYPLYGFSRAILNLSLMHSTRSYCDMFTKMCLVGGATSQQCNKFACKGYQGCCSALNFYSYEEPGIGRHILTSIATSIILFLLLLGMEYRIFKKCFYKLVPPKYSEDKEDDEDVAREKAKIREVVRNDDIELYDLIMHNMTKYYKSFLAVNNICVGVNRHECFGLLGENGAGKTTTFQMMTGNIYPSSGDAWIAGFSLKRDREEIYKLIGYCPQFDALFDNMTCRETMVMFALLRGIRLKDTKSLAETMARNFDFLPHLHKKVGHLSGGNKRKLSTVIALMGDPLIIYLDEPTTGMDPATKRYLWKELCKHRDSGKCIILTSHSMEECEALCTRLAIMVKGEFKCIGSTQHLKSRFSEGYTLIIRLKKRSMRTLFKKGRAIKNFVNENFEGADLREDYGELLTFYIGSKSLPWSEMFAIMEAAKSSYGIKDYSLGQSSLEQVFLTMTKYQETQ